MGSIEDVEGLIWVSFGFGFGFGLGSVIACSIMYCCFFEPRRLFECDVISHSLLRVYNSLFPSLIRQGPHRLLAHQSQHG